MDQPQTEPQVLVVINQHNIALLFTDFLNSEGIAANITETEEGFAVICQAVEIADAKTLFEQFIKNPHNPKYQSAAWQKAEVKDVRSSGPSLFDTAKNNFLAHAGFVTLTVFVLCWLVFLLSYLGFSHGIFQQLKFLTSADTSQLLSEPYRLLTPALFHFSLLHIAFNTLWWWQLGGDVERQLGKGSLLHIFLLTALVSNVGQYLASGPNFGGLSGVVYGLFGYVWWFGWLKPDQGLGISNNIVGFLLIWLVLGFFDVLPINMANTAHLLGLITGCLLALLKVQKLKANS
ncbi:MAG: rhomboid family intramembrane serine protease GlpG [Thalassotalea sp.]